MDDYELYNSITDAADVYVPTKVPMSKKISFRKEKLEKLTFRKAVINVEVKRGLMISVLHRNTINKAEEWHMF